jgi:hypothetical protein
MFTVHALIPFASTIVFTSNNALRNGHEFGVTGTMSALLAAMNNDWTGPRTQGNHKATQPTKARGVDGIQATLLPRNVNLPLRLSFLLLSFSSRCWCIYLLTRLVASTLFFDTKL